MQGTSFSLQWLLLLQSTGSRVHGLSSCGSQALEHRLSSSGAQALLFRGMWDLSKPGMEPVSPALADRCLTTEPPGKSNPMYFNGILGPPPINPGLTIAGWIYMWATNASSKTSKCGMHSHFHGAQCPGTLLPNEVFRSVPANATAVKSQPFLTQKYSTSSSNRGLRRDNQSFSFRHPSFGGKFKK